MATTALRILITAGPTREYLDPVRYLSNDSSGRMGIALAEQSVARGHRVTLVHGPLALDLPNGAKCIPIVSAADMLDACKSRWPKHDVLIMAAAVADYTPFRPRRTKAKKSPDETTLRLRPTCDVLATLAAERREDQLVIGFALEDRAGRRRAAEKLRSKKLDAIVLNQPVAIGAARSAVDVLVDGQAWKSYAPATKARTAQRLIRMTEKLAAERVQTG